MPFSKRVFDVVCAVIGLIVLSPLLVAIAVLVYLEDRHVPWFRHERIGQGGKPFGMWKIRTMRPDADRIGPQISIGQDPRVTSVGRLLRATKLDELPQLLNVLLGQMSLVGPRPEVRRYVDLYTPEQQAVLELRPGMTDPASVRYRNEAEDLAGFTDPHQAYIEVIMPDKIRVNLWYAARASFWSDVWVIFATIGLATEIFEAFAIPVARPSSDAGALITHAAVRTSPHRRHVAAPRNRHMLMLDVVLLSLSPLLVYALRFEGVNWPELELHTAFLFTAYTVPMRIAVYSAFGLYRRLWRYASITELELIFVAGVTASVLASLLGFALLPALGLLPARVPASVLFTNGILSIGIIAAPRFLARIGGLRAAGQSLRRSDRRRTLIAGAGATGRMIVRELKDNPLLGMIPVGFVDDDIAKHGLRLAGLPVFGALSQAAQLIGREDVQELIIAMPSARGTVVRDVVRAALDAGIKARTMPGITDILAGRVSVSALREVEIQDLLRRDPIHTNLDQVGALAFGRTVLITGAGGSIGCELARQLARLAPATLVILDHAENAVFHVQNELRESFPGIRIVPVIADVRDRRRMLAVFEKHRPFTVFHAAAHKHVPLMEDNPIEAVTNNVNGTQNLVAAAAAVAVEHFVFISTDKAVRPTSVMGATKRVAEHVVRHAALTHHKNYVAVRFGNVLGSQGSVVPTFMRQIRSGGPVTITHPEMRRYFMTIPEAVQLVLQAGALGRGGELFMLDMGDQVKIVDLATDLIRLSGLEVGTDIEVQYTGVRPGEKLYEEMFFEYEHAAPTDHPKVLRARDQLILHEMELVDELVVAAMEGADELHIRRLLRAIVPDFAPSESAEVLMPDFDVLRNADAPRRRASDGARRTSGERQPLTG